MKASPSHIPTIQAITQLLFIEDEQQPVDLVFVFGSNWLSTMDPAIAMYKEGFTSRILVTGAAYADQTREKTECDTFCEYAIEHGVPIEVILREDKARNTLENMKFSSEVIEQALGWDKVKKIAFVCKTFHARRVLMTAAKHWPAHLDYLCLPVVDERDIRADSWWQSPIATQRVLEEIQRIATYTLKGDIGDF
jgi:uncharacterized SAM-binding protein YcdF (DUF218 family)